MPALFFCSRVHMQSPSLPTSLARVYTNFSLSLFIYSYEAGREGGCTYEVTLSRRAREGGREGRHIHTRSRASIHALAYCPATVPV